MRRRRPIGLGRGIGIGLTLTLLHACGPAAGDISPERLSITAGDALREAETAAAGWADDARLRYVEGEGVRGSGRVLPGRGYWRFVYSTPARAEQLAVTVTPRAIEDVTRPPRSPAGFSIDDAAVGADWVDAPQVLTAVRASRGGTIIDRSDAAISMLLVPGRPPQWVVRVAADGETRQWRVNARTGAVIDD